MVDARTETAASPAIVLGGRYRLVRQVGTGAGRSMLWLGEDQILARLVAVRILPDPVGAGARETETESPVIGSLLTAAGQAGRAVHPRLAAVYDASTGRSRDGRKLGYVVREWCPGRSLEGLLRDGPISPAAAALIVRSVVEGLDALQVVGLSHGRLHPGNILLPPAAVEEILAPGPFRGGDEDAMRVPLEVKVSDAVIGETLALQAGARTSETRRFSVLAPDDRVTADTADLARDLYAMLTGRWPTRPGPADYPSLCLGWSGLPAAPENGDRLVLPRQLLAGVPRQADTVLARTLDPEARPRESPIRQPVALGGAVEPLLRFPHPTSGEQGTTPATGEEPVMVSGHPLRRRIIGLVVRLGIVAAVAVGGWVLGLVVGRVPGTSSKAAAPTVTPKPTVSASASPAGAEPIFLGGSGAVTAFDPPPGDGQEDDAGVPLAVDGDPSTGWETEIYQGSGTAFGGNKKHGVGLAVDLGSARSIAKVELQLSGNGNTSVELRAAGPDVTTLPTTLDGFSDVVAKGSAPTDLTLTPQPATTSRFWLVWLTALPQAVNGGGWQGDINEMQFLPS